MVSLENNLTGYAASGKKDVTNKQPTVKDPNLKVKLISDGLKYPTSMAFIDKSIIVLELINGTVRVIKNDTLQPSPLLDLNISKVIGERGLLGVTVSHNSIGHRYVFIYYTEAKKDGGEPIGNRLYRYELVDDKLKDPKLLLDLPTRPGPYHNGGSITIGPDNILYLTVGDLTDLAVQKAFSKTQNVKHGEEPNGTGGILRITQEGKAAVNGILGKRYPLNLYFAYGIRNSFGIDFDPLTGNLWDTENGPNYGDEVNLVKPGFNSGWEKVQGVWEDKGGNMGKVASHHPQGLVDFNGKGKYSEPKFIWNSTVGLTALQFLNSTKLGKNYENDIFVADVHNGTIYHFDLTKNRNGLLLHGLLEDKIANNDKELEDITFAKGFDGGISDLAVGPDGCLYVASGIWETVGKIYKIGP